MPSHEPRIDNVASAAAAGQLRTSVGLLALLVLLFVGLLGRLVYLHVHEGARLTAWAARQQRSSVPLPARRGDILDARGRLLAGARTRQSVFADPKIIPDKRSAALTVGEVLGVPASEIETDLQAGSERRFFVLARAVEDSQAERLRSADVPGLGLFDEPYRIYPMGAIGAPLIGFVAPDGHGVNGIEHQFNAWLAGRAGYKNVVLDVRRRPFWLAGAGFESPQDGLDLVLTIDAVIQEHVERVLEATVKEFGAEAAVAVVMRPGSGDVLAMATVPSFDPHNYQDFAPSRYRNRVLTDPMEPGSIFKPFVAAAALAEKVVTLDEPIDCHGGLFVDGARKLHDHHAYNILSFREVLTKSSNIGMAIVGKRLGNERMYKYVSAFGFGAKTGVELEGEDAGLLLPLHRWNSFSTLSLPMGHEIAVTPIQIARAFSALCNGGRLVRPRVVRAIIDADGRTVRSFADDQPAPRVIPESVAAALKNDVLVEAVRNGTGVNAALSNYQVFGKTGTAQIPRHGGGGYEPGAYLSSFVGGAPAYAPQLVTIVSVIRPKPAKGYFGGRVAAPAAADILGHALAYLNVPPDPAESVASRGR